MNKKQGSTQLHGVGRRKRAVARVWMKAGKGDIVVNGKDYKQYFDTHNSRLKVEQPFRVTGQNKKFDVSVNIFGGGMRGQAEAAKLGISRALLASDEALRKVLRQHELLTVDSRVKERKKYGQKGARAKFQFVKR
ncbi:30S ribosomal protein S9 [Candidatus Dependentiae bacterium]|nr:30S ribosomal protein S9 [Candidatus Dependentiae bacterium]